MQIRELPIFLYIKNKKIQENKLLCQLDNKVTIDGSFGRLINR